MEIRPTTDQVLDVSSTHAAVTVCSGMACDPVFRTSTPGYTGAPPLSAVTGPPSGDTAKPGFTTIVVEGEVVPPGVLCC